MRRGTWVRQAGFSTELKTGIHYVPFGLFPMGGKIPSCCLNVTLINVLQHSEDPRVRALFEGRGPLAARLKAAASKIGFQLDPKMHEKNEEGSWHQQLRNFWGRPNEGLQALTELRERCCTVVKKGAWAAALRLLLLAWLRASCQGWL